MTEICVGDDYEDRIWTSEWPTDPGKYWFYGFQFGQTARGLPKLSMVVVSETKQDQIVRIVDGKFMYKADGHIGFFSPAEDVVVPSLDSFEYLGLHIGMVLTKVYPVENNEDLDD